MTSIRFALAATALTAGLAGCAMHGGQQGPGYERGQAHGHGHGHGYGHGHGHGYAQGKAVAVANVAPTQGQTASGSVVFHDMGDRLMVHARVKGLKPNAEHGFHIHEKGDCSAPDATSAGGHYNPDSKPHGPQDGAHHAGDMPSLRSNAEGVADQRFVLTGVSVGGSAADIVGRGVIVHAQPDDYKTQPTGNAGARLACGVVALGR